MNLRLVSADAVEDIICKYENRLIQRTMILEVEKLNGCLATEEQAFEILGNTDIEFEDQDLGYQARKVEIWIIE